VKKKIKKAYITGIAGFAGSYLAELLLSKGWKVHGLLAPGEKKINIKHIEAEISLDRFNILNESKLSVSLKKIKPDYIFHLAAFASVGQSFEKERFVYDINFNGTLNLIQAAESLGKNLRKFVFISSSDVYGHFKPDGKTLTEKQVFNPVSPYAISKAAGEYLINYHVKRNNLPAVIARPFNHTGARQTDAFVVPSFSKQVAQIEASGKPGVLNVGDLSAKRDLSDVRDIVKGYYLAATKGKIGEVYQFCSNRSVEVRKIVEKLVDLSQVRIKVKVDKGRFRKTDIPVLRGSSKKAIRELGWHVDYKLDDTVLSVLDYWREKVTI